VKSPCQSLEILDQHHVGRFRAAREGQAPSRDQSNQKISSEVKCVTGFGGPPATEMPGAVPFASAAGNTIALLLRVVPGNVFLESSLTLHAESADGRKFRSAANAGEERIVVHRRIPAVLLLYGAA